MTDYYLKMFEMAMDATLHDFKLRQKPVVFGNIEDDEFREEFMKRYNLLLSVGKDIFG